MVLCSSPMHCFEKLPVGFLLGSHGDSLNGFWIHFILKENTRIVVLSCVKSNVFTQEPQKRLFYRHDTFQQAYSTDILINLFLSSPFMVRYWNFHLFKPPVCFIHDMKLENYSLAGGPKGETLGVCLAAKWAVRF